MHCILERYRIQGSKLIETISSQVMKLLLVLALVVVAVVAIALPDPYGHHHHHHHHNGTRWIGERWNGTRRFNGTRWIGGRWNGTRLFNRTAGRPRFTIPRIPIPVLNGSQPIPNPDVQIPEIPNPAIPIPINGGNGFF